MYICRAYSQESKLAAKMWDGPLCDFDWQIVRQLVNSCHLPLNQPELGSLHTACQRSSQTNSCLTIWLLKRSSDRWRRVKGTWSGFLLWKCTEKLINRWTCILTCVLVALPNHDRPTVVFALSCYLMVSDYRTLWITKLIRIWNWSKPINCTAKTMNGNECQWLPMAANDGDHRQPQQLPTKNLERNLFSEFFCLAYGMHF